MKIEKLIIYGFGKHENITISLDSGMNVLYGDNEAGKTTIQQFILHILFGFPQRNSAILRYEPKSGGKYGGQILLRDEQYGECTVERIRGKSAGDVTVYFPDGTTGGEEALKWLLRQYDRTSFESIFSFSLLELQHFEKMDEEELSRTLLASGTTGVDSLLQIERNMEKEMAELFKKSGRNPEINVKIKELSQLESTLKEEQEKVNQYDPAIQRIQDIEENLAQLAADEKKERDTYHEIAVLRQYVPVYKKKAELEEKMKQMGQSEFPADGIRRFESLAGKLNEVKALKRRLEEEISSLQARLSDVHASEQITAIERLLAKETEWHGWVSQISLLANEITRLAGMKNRLFDRLGMQLHEEEILLKADVSIRKEEEMFELLKEIETVDKQIELVQSQSLSIEDELKDARLKLEALETPTSEEIEYAKEWPSIRQRLAEAKAYKFLTKENTQQTKTIPILLLLLSFICIGFGFLQQQWILVISGLILVGLSTVLFRKEATGHQTKDDEMADFIRKYEHQESPMEQLLSRLSAYDYEKKQLEDKIESSAVQLRKYSTERNTLLEKSEQASLLYESFIGSYGLDGLPTPQIVPQLFRMIRDIQEFDRDRMEKEQQKRVTEESIANRLAEAEELLERALPKNAVYEIIRQEHMKLKEAAERKAVVAEQLSRLNPQLTETLHFIVELEDQLMVLKEDAKAKTAEDFYHAYDVYQQSVRYKEQLADVMIQLELSGCLEALASSQQKDLAKQERDCENALAKIDEESSLLVNEKAKLVNQTDSLLTDGTYGEKIQVFEMNKAELAELAKKWAARKAVAETIRRTMMALKDETLPGVLKKAEQLFCELTGGNYDSLQITEAGLFMAVGANGMRYPIIELSQATKEQAYISLRLALASSVLKVAPFPIIMDDPFVHFDDERLSRMIKLLHASTAHQFIYFTCHKKMKDKWVDAKIINVSEIGSDEKEFVQ